MYFLTLIHRHVLNQLYSVVTVFKTETQICGLFRVRPSPKPRFLHCNLQF